MLHGAVYDVTISGFATQRSTAWLFVDYSGCAARWKASYAGRRRRFSASESRGRLAEVTGWKSSSAGTDHACAYLAPRGRTLLLSGARLSFLIR